MLNYFNYFTEIEQRFQQRRGSVLLLSTLDWALIGTWREAGIPLEAVLRGIDDAFDKYDARSLRSSHRARKVNGLAWCAQAVMQATEAMHDAAIGGAKDPNDSKEDESGFEQERVAAHLRTNADALSAYQPGPPADAIISGIAARLRELADGATATTPNASMEDLERTLTTLEEKLFGALVLAAPENELTRLREEASRAMAPYRARMQAAQMKQVTDQFVHKRLLEARSLPRLSLFYMSHA